MSNARLQWQATFLDSPRKQLAKLCTQPDLPMILMISIQSALQDDPLFDMSTNTVKPALSFLFLLTMTLDVVPPAASPLQSPLGPDPTKDHIGHEDEISSKNVLQVRQRWLHKVLSHIDTSRIHGLETVISTRPTKQPKTP